MSEFKTLVGGKIVFRLPAEDLRLLDELEREERLNPRARARGVNKADPLIPLIRAWCRRPRPLAVVRGRKSERVHVRLRFDQQIVCREFAKILSETGIKNASSVILGLLREHVDRNRKWLEGGARRSESAARQKRFRDAPSLAEAINEFLAGVTDRVVSRAADHLDPDSKALIKLGTWVAEEFGKVTKADAQRYPDRRANTRNQVFLDEVARALGVPLPREADFMAVRHSSLGSSSRFRTQHG